MTTFFSTYSKPATELESQIGLSKLALATFSQVDNSLPARYETENSPVKRPPGKSRRKHRKKRKCGLLDAELTAALLSKQIDEVDFYIGEVSDRKGAI